MSWLQTLGRNIQKVFAVEMKVAPAISNILASIPGAQAIGVGFSALQGIIVNVESSYGGQAGSGTAKLEAATAQVLPAIEASGFLSGKQITNVAKYNAAVTAITSAMADLLNSVEVVGSAAAANAAASSPTVVQSTAPVNQ